MSPVIQHSKEYASKGPRHTPHSDSYAHKTKASGAARIISNDLPGFFRKASSMLASGLPIVDVFDSLYRQTINPSFKSVVFNLKKSVEDGNPLSIAMQEFPSIFSGLYINMITAGEAGGRLSETMERLAIFLESNVRMRRKIKSAMMYPSFVLLFAAVIFSAMLIFVVPVFSKIFDQTGHALPAPTQFMVDVSNGFRENGILIFLLLAIIVTLFKLWKSSPSGRHHLDKLYLILPICGNLTKKVSASRFARTYSELLRSGVPILQAIEISSGSTGNLVTGKILSNARQNVEQGEPLSNALKNQSAFPRELVEMLQAGEKSGHIDEMMDNIANYFDEEVEAVIGGLSSLIGPLLIIILGIIVGAMVVSIFLPIFQLPGLL